jgi:hypothetical protein
MRGALLFLLIAAAAFACTSSPPPRTATVTPPGPPPSSIPPPAPSAPPQITPRVESNEDKAIREVNARLARANQVVGQIDTTKLNSDQQEMLSGIRDFISKANDALQAHDVPRAQVLADKASRLADDLAVVMKKTR